MLKQIEMKKGVMKMMNAKKMMLTTVVMGVLSAAAVFAQEPPKCPQTLELTPQQWEMLKTMKPEQQKMAFCQGVRQNMVMEKMAKLTPEQRTEVESFIKEDREHRKMMMERMSKMTKEQRECIRLQLPPMHKHKQHFGAKGHGPKKFQNPHMMPPCPEACR